MVLESAPADVEWLNDIAAGCPPAPSVSRSGRLVRPGTPSRTRGGCPRRPHAVGAPGPCGTEAVRRRHLQASVPRPVPRQPTAVVRNGELRRPSCFALIVDFALDGARPA